MKYFIDTEFAQGKAGILPISIGVTCSDGRDYYAVLNETLSAEYTSPWLQRNVIAKLNPSKNRTLESFIRQPEDVARELKEFIRPGRNLPQIEFWGWFAADDWYILTQLYGGKLNLPVGWPQYCNDLAQTARAFGNFSMPHQSEQAHNALADALWTKKYWEYLNKYAGQYGLSV